VSSLADFLKFGRRASWGKGREVGEPGRAEEEEEESFIKILSGKPTRCEGNNPRF